MDIFDEEILQIWRTFKENNLSYIMVGGFATNLHGFSRTTADVDIWIKDTSKNRASLNNSLETIGFGRIADIDKMVFLPEWSSLTLKSGISLDIMTSLKGFGQDRFDDCLLYVSKARIFDVEVPFLHLNHLIEAKKESGRPKDLIDLTELERIRESNKKG